MCFFFFFNDTATTEIYTLSLHRRSSDLIRTDFYLKEGIGQARFGHFRRAEASMRRAQEIATAHGLHEFELDRKSTRLNSSHGYISYAVFCLKKKKDYSSQRQLQHNTH